MVCRTSCTMHGRLFIVDGSSEFLNSKCCSISHLTTPRTLHAFQTVSCTTFRITCSASCRPERGRLRTMSFGSAASDGAGGADFRPSPGSVRPTPIASCPPWDFGPFCPPPFRCRGAGTTPQIRFLGKQWDMQHVSQVQQACPRVELMDKQRCMQQIC